MISLMLQYVCRIYADVRLFFVYFSLFILILFYSYYVLDLHLTSTLLH